MASIKINFGQVIVGDAAGPLHPDFGKNNVSYLIPGQSYALLNVLFLVLTIVVFINRKNLSDLFLFLGLDEGTVQFNVGLVLVLILISGKLVALLIAFVRQRHITISKSHVVIDFPNNPLMNSRRIELNSYSGVTRRWGRRYVRRRKVEQEIIELVHTNPAYTIPIQVNENHTSSEQKIASLAKTIGIDHLVSSYGKTDVREAVAKAQQPAPPPDPRSFILDNKFDALNPPSDVMVERIIEGPMARTKLSQRGISSPLWVRTMTLALPFTMLWYGYHAPDLILVFFGSVWLAFHTWRLFFGTSKYAAILVDPNKLTLEKDHRYFRYMLFPREGDRVHIQVRDIDDIFVRRSADGKRDELSILVNGRTTCACFGLNRSSLIWIRDFVIEKAKLNKYQTPASPWSV